MLAYIVTHTDEKGRNTPCAVFDSVEEARAYACELALHDCELQNGSNFRDWGKGYRFSTKWGRVIVDVQEFELNRWYFIGKYEVID